MLTEQEKDRYIRHTMIPQIGESGQEKIKQAKVLVIGAGGLGCPVLFYLTAAGVGSIGIVDADTVAFSNLQRQILYSEHDIGKPKVLVAAGKLSAINSSVKINTYQLFLDATTAEQLFPEYDIVVGATDNFDSRYIIDKFTKLYQKPFVHGSIHEFEGQAGVFNYHGSWSYSDLFPEQTAAECLSLGVMGVLPGIIGSIMSAEVIKILTGAGDVVAGKLLVYNALDNSFNCIRFS
ncbi:MAG TPA: adenylyltransferase [Bacteroidales bacterium]|nr:adenylyltransferase [Bacteroidales bacterium]